MNFQKSEFVSHLVRDLTQPLGLKCITGFESKDVVSFINGNYSSEFEDHLNDCWICLGRILLFIKIGKLLHKMMNTSGDFHRLTASCLERIEKASEQEIEVSRKWLHDRINHVGEEAHIWLKDGQIKIEITKPPGKKTTFKPIRFGKFMVRTWRDFVKRRILRSTPSVTLAYPDPITVTLMKIFSS